MRFYQLISLIFIALCAYNCYQEDDIEAEVIPYKRTAWYDTTSTNKVVKFVSKYYYNYDRFFITDPDSSDYLYNFQSKYSDLKVTYPKQEDEHLWNGCEYVQTLLLDYYSDEFIRKHFPYSLILTDGILDPLLELPLDCFVGRYFGMITIYNLDELGAEEKKTLSCKLHEMVWTYIGSYDGVLDLPNEFFRFGSGYYGTYDWGKEWSLEELYEKGFAANKLEGWGMTGFPSEGEDIGYWISFLIRTADDEIERILNTYEAMRVKHDYLVQQLAKLGIDYKQLRYTE